MGHGTSISKQLHCQAKCRKMRRRLREESGLTHSLKSTQRPAYDEFRIQP
jgi:hypothetical protein